MLNPDFSDRTYTAEVVRIKTKADDAMRALSRLARQPRQEVEIVEGVPFPVRVIHGYIASRKDYHRVERIVTTADGRRLSIPRRVKQGKTNVSLYDVLIAQSRNHIVVAVPFHDLAERFFVEADTALAGTGARYEKVDITRLLVRLDSTSAIAAARSAGSDATLSITRCHLAYSDPNGRNRNLQQIQMTGSNLGETSQYQELITGVVSPKASDTVRVSPVILGFALSSDGVRKSSAVTDRHGNFKLWIAPGLRRFSRMFALLEALESIENVALTTPNLPILQSGSIRGADEK